MTIPRLSERLECMIFRRRLELEIEEIRPELNILRSASREVRSSIRFKGVLQVSLFLPVYIPLTYGFFRLSSLSAMPSIVRVSAVVREALSWMLS